MAAALVVAVLAGFAGVTANWLRAEHEAERNRMLLYASDMGMAQRAWDEGNLVAMGTLLQRHESAVGEKDLCGFEWHYLSSLYQEALATPTIWHDAEVLDVAFFPDGKKLATFCAGGGLRLWDVQRRELLYRKDSGQDSARMSLAISPDGTLLATGGNKAIMLWDALSGELIHTFTHQSQVVGVEFSPNGTPLAVETVEGGVLLWDAASASLRRRLKAKRVASLAFSQNGTLAMVRRSGSLLLWNLDTGSEPRILDHPTRAHSVTFTPDGAKMIVGRSPSEISIWDTETWQQEAILSKAANHFYSIACSPDGKTLAAGGQQDTIRLWDLGSRELLTELKVHTSDVNAIAFSPSGNMLASTSLDKSVQLWNITRNHTAVPSVGRQYWSVGLAASPVDRQLWAFSGEGKDVYLCDLSTGSKRALGYSRIIRAVAFSPDGRTLALASADSGRGTISLRDIHSERTLQTLTAATAAVWSVAFSPDGTLLASGTDTVKTHQGGVRLWRLPTYEYRDLYRDFTGWGRVVLTIAFSPDGKMMAVGGGGWGRSGPSVVTLWHVTVDPPRCIERLTDDLQIVYSVAFSPDGQ